MCVSRNTLNANIFGQTSATPAEIHNVIRTLYTATNHRICMLYLTRFLGSAAVADFITSVKKLFIK